MRRILLAAVALLMALGLSVSVGAQQKTWFELYDEARQHVTKGDWGPAETKLLAAKKGGPAPGRNVLRYGSWRDDYFPDYYLGVVYLNTNRPQLAAQQFDLAITQKLNTQDREFQQIASFQVRAKEEVTKLAGNITKPTGSTEVPKATDVPTGTKPELPPPPTNTGSGPSPVDVQRGQIIDRLEAALRNRDVSAARGSLAELQKVAPDTARDTAYSTRIATLEHSIRLTDTERNAMRAFFAGNYNGAVSAIDAVEKTGPLSPRSYFYRACSLAALAIRGPAVDAKILAQARQQYAEARKQGQAIAGDRRYVSPRILQLLES